MIFTKISERIQYLDSIYYVTRSELYFVEFMIEVRCRILIKLCTEREHYWVQHITHSIIPDIIICSRYHNIPYHKICVTVTGTFGSSERRPVSPTLLTTQETRSHWCVSLIVFVHAFGLFDEPVSTTHATCPEA